MASAKVKFAQSFDKGNSVESLFQDHFKKMFGYPCFKSSNGMDVHKHIDFWCENEKFGIQSFDVKGMKKIQRKDKKPTDKYHWVEIQNVNGKSGWLYGHADFIVFETEEAWLFVKTGRLQRLVEKVKIEEYVYPPEPYKLYTRKKFGRDDICILLPTEELKKIGSLKHKPKG